MKKYIFLIVFAVSMPAWVGAHGEVIEFNENQTSQNMMRHIEDQTLGGELHEEMEALMEKLMTGELTKQEAGRVAELMIQYPGPQSMMMNRMMSGNGLMGGFGFGMMPFGWGGAWIGALWLLYLVWLVVGLLAAAWLYKSILKK